MKRGKILRNLFMIMLSLILVFSLAQMNVVFAADNGTFFTNGNNENGDNTNYVPISPEPSGNSTENETSNNSSNNNSSSGPNNTSNNNSNSNSNSTSNNNSNNNSNSNSSNRTNNTSNNNSNNNSSNRNVSNNNSNNQNLAETGLSGTSGIIALIIVICGISAIYSFKKVNDYKNL